MLIGCSGEYVLTAPNHVAPVGVEAPVVVRLQRREFYRLFMSVKDAPVQFQIGDGPERAAYTDDLGYAATTLAALAKAGKYCVKITHQDRDGDILTGEATIYAWDAARPVVAVDLDSLPDAGSKAAQEASSALAAVARRANMLYMTRRPIFEHGTMHAEMTKAGFPDGPVLLWQRQYWHIRPVGRYRVPKVIVETRLVSQLTEVRKVFPRLQVGVCASDIAARAFVEAGLQCLVIGQAGAGLENVKRRQSWAELASAGI